jgi:NADP-dependent 3-hydroxy acid dehydrogenase YdfG
MTTSPVTLITGGSTGTGAATARRLLDLGHRVAVTGRDTTRLDRLASDLNRPSQLLTLPGDAADNTAVEAAVSATLDRFGRLDVAIANAGYTTAGSVAEGDPAAWHDMVLTNVLGPALLIRATLPALKTTRGRIVLVGSVAGLVHTPGNLYGATKWALTGLAENTRRLVTSDGIGVTLVAPGRVDTPFWDALGGPPPQGQGLTATQLADTIAWTVTQPPGVDVNTLTVRPIGQSV